MKIGYFADGPWSHNAFKLIQSDDSFDIKFICPRFDTKDMTLKNFSKEFEIDYFTNKNINSSDFIEKIKPYDCDIFVSMSFNQIFKKEIINLTKHKIINCHAGLLPFYRGRNILNWVLINDEKEFGITVHYVDEGIDTGDIILQEKYPISDDDNYKTLLEKSYVECAHLLYSSLKKIQTKTFSVVQQKDIHPIGMYCGIRKSGDEVIDWNSSSRDIFNFIRALCKPGPMATTSLKGLPFYINSAQMIEEAPCYKGNPGQILYREDKGLIVKTKDSFIKIVDFLYDEKIKIGERLQ